MRKVIFTEAQLKKLIGEDLFDATYNTPISGEEPENSYGTQVGVSDKIDGEETDTPIPDSIKMGANNKFFRVHGYRSVNEDKKKTVTESNKNTDNKKIKFNSFEKERIKNDAENGSKVAQNIVDRGFELTSNNANVIKSRGGSEGMSNKTFNNIDGKNKNIHAVDNITRNGSIGTDITDNALMTPPSATKGTGKSHHTNGEQLANGGTVYYNL